ncbi:helix-turn-helix transcriptional regulator [Inconstantimicrobium mannanitabidum]|uniref:AraC family transcriptional regulator n=1 Tax=Inconstantimicrobium mannanitabidum TaxID=1604901 RepID=A0ACB5RG02_9CLOT|nr:helix-turn-helix transcriptional regulator [Clostridium sp. TW13]GKX68012.1 AraC family transcriptional regulator [Clostridium sp. TW13]
MFFDDISIKEHLKIGENPNQIYIAPHPLLRKYIAHYTISFPDKDEIKKGSECITDLTLIPDSSGCIIYTYENNKISSSIWGATTKTVIVKKDFDLPKIRFFVEFMPGGLGVISGIKQSELCDIQTEVGQVSKVLEAALYRAMEVSNNVDDLIYMVDTIFLRIIEKNKSQHEVITSALDIIKFTNGILTVKQLSSENYVSERHLNRLFNEYIGVSTKTFLRLARINYSMNLFKKYDYKSCLNISQVLGYFDQSHFTHDFKHICGVSPDAFLKNMSDFYNESFKY